MAKFKRSFAVVMAFLLIFGNASLALGTSTDQVQSKQQKVIDKVKEQLSEERKALKKKEKDNKASLKANDKVRVIVEVDGQTPLEYATKKGVLYKELSKSTKNSLNTDVVKKQKNVKDLIKSKNIKVNYKYNFTTSFNGFSGEVTYKEVAKIEDIQGVKNVYLANEYKRPEVKPNMKNSHSFIQSYQTWADAKFKGEGMVVSVIDTGVDPSHKDFVLSNDTEEELSSTEVEKIVSDSGLKGKFFTEKVPYGFNYYDQNDTILDLGPSASMHGMHVAGTVAANGDVANGGIKGVAPEAQVLAMKVFSNDPNYPSTWSDVYLAAIDDSIELGADVLNMSLGSTASFYESESPEDLAITRAVENGIVCAVSAGNSGHIGYGWDNPYFNNPDIGVVGAPGLNTDSIQVAASGNVAYKYVNTFALEGGSFSAKGYGLDSWTELAGKEVVSLSQLNGSEEVSGESCKVCGSPENYVGKDVTGKIVLVKRGDLSFYDKTVFAAEAGAAGIIVYDHGLSGFYDNQGGWPVPFSMLHEEDGVKLEAAIKAGHTTLNVSQDSKTEDVEMGRMTAFTSWGTTPSLELKPEITAPGGNIYSTLQDNQYGVMSGTSMAAPHVAGGSALVQQYLQSDNRFSDLDAEDRTRLAKVLLMNTAKIIDDLNDQPFSPRRQGAGMMQTYAAVSTPVYVVEEKSSEGKVELKDFTSEKFSMDFTAYNLTDKAVTYNVDTRVLTDMFSETDAVLYNSLIAGDMEGAVVDAPKTITVPADGEANFTVSVDISEAKIPGFNKDGEEITKALQQNIFVEGFVTLSDKEGIKPALSVPYVGFYGDWNSPDIIDGFKDLGEERYFDLDKYFGEDVQEMLTGPSGSFVSAVVDGDETLYPVSPNGDGQLDNIYPLPSFLRNAEEVQFNILDENKKLVRTVVKEKNVRKSFFDAGEGTPYSFSSARAWDGTVKSEVVEDGLYYYEIKATVDEESPQWQTKQIPVYLDTTVPEVTASFDEKTSVLSWEVKEGGVGVLSYFIFVDGELVDTVSADQNTYNLNSVSDDSVIEIAAADHARNIGSASLVPNDVTEPVIYLEKANPAPYGAYDTNEVLVKGYIVEDVALESIKVNGKEVDFNFNNAINVEDKTTVAGYEFTTNVTFEEDDKYDVIVTATDVAGNEYSIARKVFIDTTKPELNVKAPKVVDHDQETVSVTVNMKDNYNALSLTVDDNHEFELPFESPISILDNADETVKVDLAVEPGNNTYQFKLVDVAGNEITKDVTIYRNESDSRVSRLAGEDRYDTAVKLSKEGWEKAEVVVLARGDNYADALAGIPLAKKYDAPLLLTGTASLPDSTLAEIKRLGVKKVYILGGTVAINASVQSKLKSQGLEVERIKGENRFETAAIIAKEVAPNGVNEAVVVNGRNFPDALSVASYAAKNGSPILLTETKELPKHTKYALSKLGVSKTYVIGGKVVIKNNVLVDLPNPVRIAGENRYETAVEVAEYFKADQSQYYVATGTDFADALSGAALAAKDNTGILLVGKDVPESVGSFIKENNVELLSIIGGKVAVSTTVANKLNKLID
ncbi:cell wall-binding repeat-containing protein [Rossellomorea sp. BNER]|uniref:cell wall-binding repeat-containing protein n=1 Tax=Rossellomorea sp. BNER TaxID=2962031 RepID=UPI003AF2E046|nr:cell wall-binding repeat-containing protein [Rossellomorea sp. BNER]